jgi:hypothetical protein
MKTIIEYSESLDDQMALNRALKATDMAIALFEIQVNIKGGMIRMLDMEDATDAEYDVLDKVWDRINAEFEERNINIKSLIN